VGGAEFDWGHAGVPAEPAGKTGSLMEAGPAGDFFDRFIGPWQEEGYRA